MFELLWGWLMGDGEPTAWIIERPHCLPMLTHYRTVADAHAKLPGVYVTPFYSRVRP